MARTRTSERKPNYWEVTYVSTENRIEAKQFSTKEEAIAFKDIAKEEWSNCKHAKYNNAWFMVTGVYVMHEAKR